jgi:hypothetical protein
VIALRRLGLYEDAYGWTMLRMTAKAGGIWLGAVLALLAVRIAGVRRDRAWFLPAVAVVGVAVVIALNAVNPEAAVVRHNVTSSRHELDPQYLTDLSDDAVPTIVHLLPTIDAASRARIITDLCARPARATGVLSWNRSQRAAQRAIDSVC